MWITNWFEILVSVLTAVLASSGVWTLLLKRMEKKDLKTQVLIGLGHDRIIYLGMTYIERGYITRDEYENLNDYLYKPYLDLGGNGSAERVMTEVRKLPIKNQPYIHPANPVIQLHSQDGTSGNI